MPKRRAEQPLTIKELKTYLGIDGGFNNSLLADFLNTAKDLTEKVLRYELSRLNPIPFIVKEALKYAVAYLYTNRETANILELEKMLAVILSAHRRQEF